MHMRSIILVICLSHVLGIKASERIYFSKGCNGEEIFTRGSFKVEEVFEGHGTTYLATITNDQGDRRYETHRPRVFNQLKREYSEQPILVDNVQWLDKYDPRDVQYCFFLGLTAALGLGLSYLSYLASCAR